MTFTAEVFLAWILIIIEINGAISQAHVAGQNEQFRIILKSQSRSIKTDLSRTLAFGSFHLSLDSLRRASKGHGAVIKSHIALKSNRERTFFSAVEGNGGLLRLQRIFARLRGRCIGGRDLDALRRVDGQVSAAKLYRVSHRSRFIGSRICHYCSGFRRRLIFVCILILLHRGNRNFTISDESNRIATGSPGGIVIGIAHIADAHGSADAFRLILFNSCIRGSLDGDATGLRSPFPGHRIDRQISAIGDMDRVSRAQAIPIRSGNSRQIHRICINGSLATCQLHRRCKGIGLRIRIGCCFFRRSIRITLITIRRSRYVKLTIGHVGNSAAVLVDRHSDIPRRARFTGSAAFCIFCVVIPIIGLLFTAGILCRSADSDAISYILIAEDFHGRILEIQSQCFGQHAIRTDRLLS